MIFPKVFWLSGSSPGWLSKWSIFRHELHELSLIFGFFVLIRAIRG